MAVLTFQPSATPSLIGEVMAYTVAMFDGEQQYLPADDHVIGGVVGEDFVTFEVVEGNLIVPETYVGQGPIELSVVDGSEVEIHSGSLEITVQSGGGEEPGEGGEEPGEGDGEEPGEGDGEEPGEGEVSEELLANLSIYGCDTVVSEDRDGLAVTIRNELLTRDDVLIHSEDTPVAAVRREFREGHYVIQVVQLGELAVPAVVQELHDKILTGPVRRCK